MNWLTTIFIFPASVPSGSWVLPKFMKIGCGPPGQGIRLLPYDFSSPILNSIDSINVVNLLLVNRFTFITGFIRPSLIILLRILWSFVPLTCDFLPLLHERGPSITSSGFWVTKDPLSLGKFMTWPALFPLSISIFTELSRKYLIQSIDLLHEHGVASIHFLFEKTVHFGGLDKLFGYNNLAMLFFGFVEPLLENVRFLHVLFA